eukprot:TRINITY_DN11496_c0_g1_i10.p1 TRINITY_DN11496_c0_g1~~TRINITY_DN11496_c0_g1_i10.p1  ORF type:complete len:105 (+),score=2.36 TRINITY_DN11496_c0_g1_i10:520-834(+)
MPSALEQNTLRIFASWYARTTLRFCTSPSALFSVSLDLVTFVSTPSLLILVIDFVRNHTQKGHDYFTSGCVGVIPCLPSGMIGWSWEYRLVDDEGAATPSYVWT